MKLNKKLKAEILSHAEKCFPAECCGVIVSGMYIPCRNVAEKGQFQIHHEDLANAEDQGEIQAYVHSHPNATARASYLDLLQIELHEMPWVICAWPEVDFQVYKPCGYKAPLIGRDYHHGYQDCYSIIRDFYNRELGIQLIDFERKDDWWSDKNHKSLYLENLDAAGFYEVREPQYGDMLVCNVGRTEHPNHAVIWLGDQWQLKSEESTSCFGGPLILHHPYGRKSVREIFGQQWQERVVKIVRHKNA
ncbi:C40 family peptidase [Acinetobacter guillouiae]|uniref:C40 family peptidase n=1 Tax=Acinetobacter guillouiae TaxID=106649 RepID=UPI0028F0CCA3|nr:C40 family peptidase [Acinetobacter guillouiae]